MSQLTLDVNPVSFMVVQARDAVDWIAQLAHTSASSVRNGAIRVRKARDAMMQLVDRGTAMIGDDELHAIVWLFATAERVAKKHGDTAVKFVQTTARSIADTLVRTRSSIAFEIVRRAFAPKKQKLRMRPAKSRSKPVAAVKAQQAAG
jgi:hypothetical protein